MSDILKSTEKQMKAAVEKGSSKEPVQQPEWSGHTEDIKKKFGLV